MKDINGNELRVGDKVVFVSWGYNISLSMTQGEHTVVGFGRTRVRLKLADRNDEVSARTDMVKRV